MVMSLWSRFLGHPVDCWPASGSKQHSGIIRIGEINGGTHECFRPRRQYAAAAARRAICSAAVSYLFVIFNDFRRDQFVRLLDQSCTSRDGC